MVRAESFEALELREEMNMNYQIEKERIVRSNWRGKYVIFFGGKKILGFCFLFLGENGICWIFIGVGN